MKHILPHLGGRLGMRYFRKSRKPRAESLRRGVISLRDPTREGGAAIAVTGDKRSRHQLESDEASTGAKAAALSASAKRPRHDNAATSGDSSRASDSDQVCNLAELFGQRSARNNRGSQLLIKARERDTGKARVSGYAGSAGGARSGSGSMSISAAKPLRKVDKEGSHFVPSSTPLGPSEFILWLQRKGAKGSVPLKAASDSLVGFLLEEVDTKLKLDAPLDAITLHLMAHDTDGKDQLVLLDNMDTIPEALIKASAQLGRAIAPTDKLRIVVDVAASASLAAVAALSDTASADAREATVHVAAAAAMLAKLKAAVLKAEVKEIELGCQLLILPNDAGGKPMSWPGLESNTLFVRPEFKRMFEDILGAFSPTVVPLDRRHKLLRGIPGIGKSSFGMYALWRLVTAGRSVLYEYPKGLPKGTVLAFGAGEPEVNIADGCTPFWPVKETGPALLVISSPRGGEGRPFYDEFSKDSVPIYLREPKSNELMAMGKHCFGLRDDDEDGQTAARDRISRHGPVPRFVFGRTAAEAKMLEEAIVKQKISALRMFAQSMDESAVVRDISFRVVHYEVSDDCFSVSYRWATPFVGERVADVLQAADVNDRLALLSELLRAKQLRSMSGPLFERWCDTKMSEGGHFRIRRLGVGGTNKSAAVKRPTGKAAKKLFKEADASLSTADFDEDGCGTITIAKAATTAKIKKVGELPVASEFAGTRFAAKGCFAAADFIEANGVSSNATVEAMHDLIIIGKKDTNGLLPIVKQLQPEVTWAEKTGVAVPFMWLVPPVVFEDCRAGTMQIIELPATSPKTDASKARAALEVAARHLAPWVVQYAVEIPDPKSTTEG